MGPASLCFVVLLGRFATDIPRARLLKIKYLQMPKNPIQRDRLSTNHEDGAKCDRAPLRQRIPLCEVAVRLRCLRDRCQLEWPA